MLFQPEFRVGVSLWPLTLEWGGRLGQVPLPAHIPTLPPPHCSPPSPEEHLLHVY